MCVRLVAGLFVVLSMNISARAQSSLASTPPMGWNSWNHFACKVTAADVRGAADAIAKNGMKEPGYIYVNVYDFWQGRRQEKWNTRPNKNFGGIKSLSRYYHAKA